MLTKRELLQDKIELKQKELEAEFAHLKADTREVAMRERERILETLSELDATLKGGWDNINARASEDLNAWLSRNKS